MRRHGRDPFWWLLLLLPPLLLLPDLGDGWLWQDEAETALLARSVLRHGLPRARPEGPEGPLLSDQPDAADVSEDGVWIWAPWLPHYVTAASFALLGPSGFAARLPFALLGWAGLLLAYSTLQRLTEDRSLARLAVLLLALSVPYLLLARQCRYYSLLALLATAHLAAYAAHPRRGSATGMGLAGAGLAWCFPPQLAVSAGAAAVHAAWLRRDPRRLRAVLVSAAAAGAAALPYLVYARFWDRDYRGAGYGFDSWLRYGATLRGYWTEIELYAWPFFLALPLAWRACASLPERPRAALRAAIVAWGAGLLLALVATPSPASLTAIIALSAAGAGAALVALAARARAGSRAAGSSSTRASPPFPSSATWPACFRSSRSPPPPRCAASPVAVRSRSPSSRRRSSPSTASRSRRSSSRSKPRRPWGSLRPRRSRPRAKRGACAGS